MESQAVHELMSKESALRQSTCDWILGLAPWSCFFTGTFAGEYSESATERAWRRFMGGKSAGRRSRFGYVVVSERNPNRAGHHVHAVLFDPQNNLRRTDDLWKPWFDRFGRAKAEPIRSQEDVVNYCTKHVLNYLLKGYGWWDIRIPGESEDYRNQSTP